MSVNRNSKSTMRSDNYIQYALKDILPADDAFHGSIKHVAAEWWYFDAIFTNNYSLHVGCRTFSKKNFGLVSPFLEIYKDGKLVADAVKRYFFRDFHTSSEFPMVKLAGDTIIGFDEQKYRDKKEWMYELSLKIDECEVHLKFIGTTKGWKYETAAESWVVALPKASVTGEIIIDGDKMEVQGTGYHDHNWNYTIWTPINYGKAWYWGRIISETFNLSWAKIMKTSSQGELLAIINQDDKGYFPVNPENIHFKSNRFIYNHRRKIPTSFTLKIDDTARGAPINVDIQMDTYNIHYSRALFFPYWRYHVKSTGFISVGSHKEVVNNTQIMEYLKFS
ncbi:MAG: hypothetical protein QHH19_03735 [Candidatus Thermoplasmatota archaeon]|nr:hypothetical protein [Candidatus Thermoplasmatota archaeon]